MALDSVEALKAAPRPAGRPKKAVTALKLADDGPSTLEDIVARTDMTSGNASTYKRLLLEQGVIDAASRGEIRFALPFLREHLPRYLGDVSGQ